MLSKPELCVLAGPISQLYCTQIQRTTTPTVCKYCGHNPDKNDNPERETDELKKICFVCSKEIDGIPVLIEDLSHRVFQCWRHEECDVGDLEE